MASASRLLRTCRALQIDPSSSSSPSTTSNNALRFLRRTAKIAAEKRVFADSETKPVVAVKASAVSERAVSERQQTKGGVDLALLAANVAGAALSVFRHALKRKSWQVEAEMFIDRGIINCRFFTLIAVAGSLLGSILCFVEGCFLILESFFEYFQTMAQRTDRGQVVQLLIEALDSFLIGTAMLVFGMGMYAMFVGSKEMKRNKGWLVPESSFFGLFPLKRLPSWVEMESVSQAKSKIGHAVVMLLQAGAVEKFKNAPMANGLDLACFAGAILFSSACIFLLSRLYMK
ncbi:uncharacterized protein LOC131229656 [Magnolia sinica]|uniref:uncharacterized protein LOC131229656 n=1 Tax=Magnolia sinica TaxID=86752 RepID=UPI0026587404|nr:uncharacterized protein LOC131229656 [Magnolia sinica]